MKTTLSIQQRAFLNRCAAFARRIVPQACLLCGAWSGSACLCRACDDALVRLPVERCERCALPVTAGRVCGSCLSDPPRYDATLAAFAYAFPLDALVQALKYGGRLVIARLLGEALAQTVAAELADLIVPMPLSVQRLRERGFNQALEIARPVARATGIPLAPRACRRVIDTPAQAALPWKARAGNVRGAFVCDRDVRGLNVAVVDDVMTTGATVNELARNLRRAGAAEIRVWVVARALKHDAPFGANLERCPY